MVLLLSQTYSTTVQCETKPSDYARGKHFFLSAREKLVSTIYKKVDVIADSMDGAVSRVIIAQGLHEGFSARIAAQFVKKGDTVLNVGSHVGLEAVILGRIIGDKGRLFVIEPYPVSYNMVLKNIYLNKIHEWAHVYNVGASSETASGFIAVPLENTGNSQIHTGETMGKSDNKVKRVPVDVDLVDNIIPSDAVVNFVLIDTEGYEVPVLEGMKQTLLRSPNVVVMCEWSMLLAKSAKT